VGSQIEGIVHGFWFAMRMGEVDIATVYSPAYASALNASLAR
jgi:hypothetical protein